MFNRRRFIVTALLVLCISLSATQVLAFSPVYNSNNNFTMLDPDGGGAGGTNDIVFTWDGTLKTSVAVSAQVNNATIASVTVTPTGLVGCPFNGFTWKAHDVAIYGPGTYTVYASCLPKAPGCATGTNPITFTVGPDEIGAHILFDWGTVSTNKNIDVVNVWKQGLMFGPSPMWTGACGSNPADKVWDLMSKDPGTGINGYPIVDGGFIGFRANFNMMGPVTNRVVDTLNNNFTMNQPDAIAFGGTNDVRFTWDGTKKTSVAVSGQVSNATISSTCLFFGRTWWAHDMAIYGPGTYTVYTDCPAGSPGCGLGVPYTFTVKPGEIGGHVLLYWGANENFDVVNVWKRGSFDQGVDPDVCLPAEFWAGACGTGDPAKVWDWMSYDWDNDCVNGAGMVDGPMQGMSVSFNLTGVPPVNPCDDNNLCTADTYDPMTGTCRSTPVSCYDGNACTADSCDIIMGCIHTVSVVCNDNNACTTDACVPATGNCMFTPKNCNDNNACTIDTCNPATGCVFTPVSCNDGNLCTIDSCNTATGACQNVQRVCNDSNPCTIDTCNTTIGTCEFSPSMNCCSPDPTCNDGNECTRDYCDLGGCFHDPLPNGTFCAAGAGTCNAGVCVSCGSCITSIGNNFTMMQPDNYVFGGTNDVTFVWDGTRKTSVAASGQISNAALSSTCAFFGVKWAAHDVAVYGPGTYTVCSGCPAGSPGCGIGPCITFTVKAGEIGIHMLFDWNGNYDIDVVNVMMPNAASSNMWTGSCGSNAATTIWNWASYDFDGDGVNGTAMVDGPFQGMNVNFNLSKPCGGCGCINCDDNNACTTDSCDPVTGCVHTPINCNDNNACTVDSCNTATGVCVHTSIPGCDPQCAGKPNGTPCEAELLWHDPSVCYNDYCSNGVCVMGVEFSCNDNNPCTADFCEAATGVCVNVPLPDNTACTVNNQPGTCTAGACIVAPVCNGVKSVTIRGGGQKASSVDLQIQTNFTVVNGGCIVGSTASTVTCTPGTNLVVNVKAGNGPMPTSCTWKGVPISPDSQLTVACPATSGDVGKLICDNKLGGGKDADKMTITVQ